MSDTPYTFAEFLTRWADVTKASAALVGPSLADRLALVERDEPGFIERMLEDIGPQGSTMLAFDQAFWLRPKQRALLGDALGMWRILLYVGGRGGGKTRPATEWLVSRLERGARELVIVGPTYDEIGQFMLGGHKRRVDAGNGSGLLDVMPPWIRYHHKSDEGVIEFPDHKAVLRLHSGEVPEYRGPAPDTVWCDEVIKWRYPERLLSNLRLACREVGRVPPQILITTSPKRYKYLRDLVMEEDVVTIHSKTRENRGNVDERWFQGETRRLGDTLQGREELEGDLGIDDEGELFPLTLIDKYREDSAPELERIVVGVDPAGSKHRKSDDTGIIAAGRAGDIQTGHGYVLADKTGRYTWDGWGEEAFKLLEDLGASAFVLERNKFADAVAANIRTAGAKRGWRTEARPGSKHLLDLTKDGRRVQIVEVLAMGDKAMRAGPVSTLYQSGRMHHVGHLAACETEMSEWDPTLGFSPGRIDALVHATTELFALDRAPTHDGHKAMVGMTAANAQLDRTASSGGPQWLSVSGDRRGGRRLL